MVQRRSHVDVGIYLASAQENLEICVCSFMDGVYLAKLLIYQAYLLIYARKPLTE